MSALLDVRDLRVRLKRPGLTLRARRGLFGPADETRPPLGTPADPLAAAIMSPQFQEVFNLNKGSIPVRLNMNLDKFDECAKVSAADFVSTSKAGALVPSAAHGMAIPSAAEGAIKDVVSQFWNDDKATPAATMGKLVQAAKTKTGT